MADADRALTEAIGRFGLDAVTSQPNLCRNTLRDKLPDQPRQSALLVTALEAGVPSRLVRESAVSDVDTVTARLASGLEQSHGLSPENARWAVQTWASALKLANPETPSSGGAVNSLDAGTVIRTPPAGETASPEASAAPPEPVTAPPPASGPVPAPPELPGDVTAAPTPRADVTAPPAAPGEGTVLRSAPDARATPPPAGPPDRPPTSGGPPRRRRLVIVAGVLVLVGVIVAVAVVVLSGSKNSPHRAAQRSTSRGASTSMPASSTKPASPSASSKSSTAKVTATFASISPVLAHRGDHEGFPQETLPAFLQAAQRGYTIETDVRWTKDGVPVITHDTTTGLGMVCQGGPYAVAQTTWSVLHSRCRTDPSTSKTHKAYGIPTFDDTVKQVSRVPGSTLFAEIKTDQTRSRTAQFIAILRKWHMTSRTVATSFVTPYLANFSKEAAAEHVSIRTVRFASANVPTTLADLQHARVWGAVFLAKWNSIPSLMASAHRAGIHVGIAPSPDAPAGWSQGKRLGTEFLLTDHPLAYRAWLK